MAVQIHLQKVILYILNDGVNADFSLSSLNVCKKPATAVFKNNSEGSGQLNYIWNFDDGSTATFQRCYTQLHIFRNL